ncbi:MAG: hypothetical protein ACRCXB_35290 [Aeromonadaceae bacterium]
MISDPLSFSQNIHQDLSNLVRSALSELGVSNDLTNHFDSHSTISIDLDEGSSINISLIEDRIYIWSFLNVSEEQLIMRSHLVIPSISNHIPCAEGGGCTLLKVNDGYELRMHVSIKALQGGLLSKAILSFYQVSINLH